MQASKSDTFYGLHVAALKVRMKNDLYSMPHKEIDLLAMQVEKEPIYRLRLGSKPSVAVSCYDLIENFAPELESEYDSVNDLPIWAQEKLAVLMLLDPKQINDPIEGVGRRINEHVFWIIK